MPIAKLRVAPNYDAVAANACGRSIGMGKTKKQMRGKKTAE
jgi:hypothetical protein